MLLEQLTNILPLLALVAGALLLAWGQKDRLAGLVAQFRPAGQPEPQPSATDRFEKYLALRTWCEQAGQPQAVKALDSVVLPALVQRGQA